MIIYAVMKKYLEEKWSIFQAEAEEKPKSYIIKNRCAAFGYIHRIPKIEAHLTPSSAIKAEIEEQKQILEAATKTMMAAKNNITQLNKLRNGLIGGD